MSDYTPRGRALVIDDDASIRRLIAAVLRRNRFEVIEADCPEAAVEQALSTPCSLATVDLRMPGVGGFGAIDALRIIDPRLPIVVVSAETDSRTRRRVERRGVPHFVGKPICLGGFERTVVAALATPVAQPQHRRLRKPAPSVLHLLQGVQPQPQVALPLPRCWHHDCPEHAHCTRATRRPD